MTSGLFFVKVLSIVDMGNLSSEYFYGNHSIDSKARIIINATDLSEFDTHKDFFSIYTRLIVSHTCEL